ncbi:MAG TPA: TlpA disulfide reductase family protein [Pseudomonadales bacterium]|nr:TlpA disulfide reductase family protein [Pseudomonadales bacterium]HNH70827.1 TlpA disulfide reductase family protein [Pseudomonadales bacterium]HNL24344.1 TlpA disulfide reductase family protein [Pseudomonadales bacterium]
MGGLKRMRKALGHSTIVTRQRLCWPLRLLLLTALLLVGCGMQPDFVDANGRSGRFSDHANQWLLINYWASWCAPCREEMPQLNQLAKERSDQLALFAVNFDQLADDELRKQAQAIGIEFRVLRTDPIQQFGYQRPTVLPVTYLISPDRRQTIQLLGPQNVASIEAALAKASATP